MNILFSMIVFLAIMIGIGSMTVCSPIEHSSHNKSPYPLQDTKHHHIINTFGLTPWKDLSFLFSKQILIRKDSHQIPVLASGKLIYWDSPSQKKIPESYGEEDLVILETRDKLRYHYSQFIFNGRLKLFSFMEIREHINLGQYTSHSISHPYFSLRIDEGQEIFYHPMLFMKTTEEDKKDHQLIIGKVLLESGILIKAISSEKILKIPLRKSFSIYVHIFEQTSKINQKILPQKTVVSITDLKSNETVFHQTIHNTKIQRNKLGNELMAGEIYKQYNTPQMLNMGIWTKKNRLSPYQITVKATSFYGIEVKSDFFIEFY